MSLRIWRTLFAWAVDLTTWIEERFYAACLRKSFALADARKPRVPPW